MLKRLGLVIHWLGFITGCILFLLPVVVGADLATILLFGTFSFMIFSVCSWSIRYILAGKVNFFPWK